MKPSALLIHVHDVQQGLNWYSRVFPNSKAISFDDGMPTALLIDGFLLELVISDEKVGSGKFGTIMYWMVPQLDFAIQSFIGIGAKLYRGPMAIEDGLGMCQLEDPFGNLIGLRGPYSN